MENRFGTIVSLQRFFDATETVTVFGVFARSSIALDLIQGNGPINMQQFRFSRGQPVSVSPDNVRIY